MNSESYSFPKNSDNIGSNSSNVNSKITFNVTRAFSLLANVGNQRYDRHENVIRCDSIDHLFLNVVYEFIMGQQNISPLLAEFWVSHNTQNLKASFFFFPVSHDHFDESVFYNILHADVNLVLWFEGLKDVFAKFKHSGVLGLDGFI